jgi:transposase
MIGLAAGTRIWIVAGVTDMRRGSVEPSGIVRTAQAENPFSRQVFVFRGKRVDLTTLLWRDGDGLCVLAKRPERRKFTWPQAANGTDSLTAAHLSMLMEGID